MTRKDAEQLLGTKVRAWTSANGVYAGTLVEVLPSRPWRGKVLITGVFEPALAFEYGRGRQRRGLRPGETIEVGGVNISPTTEDGVSYLDALNADRARHQRHIADLEQQLAASPKNAVYPNHRIGEYLDGFRRGLAELEKRIAEEEGSNDNGKTTV